MPIGFIGEYEYRVDSKGRLPLPPPFRERLAREGGILAPGLDGCLRLYLLTEWERRTDEEVALGDNTLKNRRLLRFHNTLSFSLEVDRQSRITLPLTLRQYAGIQETALVVGMSHYIEIWSLERWQEEKNKFIEEAWQNSESRG